MKNTVIKFSIISSLIMAIGMVITMHFANDIGFDKGELVGYTVMVIAFLMVFFGVRSYRDKINGEAITFGQAFKVGGLIALISCLVYVGVWLILYYNFMPDFSDKYAAYAIDQMKSAHKSQAEIDAAMKEMVHFKELYKNPFINAAITFTEPLPVALIMALLSALILKKKKVADTQVV
ncbi:MAG TPA: DUF4199 domain-containing protein [Bacteroidia bacterium]|nr:DUF4199 domain-containing protein [Bacteroidia bacterium]